MSLSRPLCSFTQTNEFILTEEMWKEHIARDYEHTRLAGMTFRRQVVSQRLLPGINQWTKASSSQRRLPYVESLTWSQRSKTIIFCAALEHFLYRVGEIRQSYFGFFDLGMPIFFPFETEIAVELKTAQRPHRFDKWTLAR